jgi:hypothetical protein
MQMRFGLKCILLGLCISHALVFPTSCVSNNEEELYPDQTCDTLNVTYSGIVAPIISLNCERCHSAVAPSSGIPLEGYDHLKAAVDDGKLLGSIRHDEGFIPMPEEAPKLPDCDIRQIEIWVEDGAPDN